MFKGAGLIFRKEMWTAFRDRRTLIFLVAFPLLVWPLSTAVPTLLIQGRERKAEEKPSSVALVSFKETGLKDFLKKSKLVRLVAVKDPAKAVAERQADCVVYVDSLSTDSMVLYTRVFYDATQTGSKVAANKVELVLSTYEQEVVRQRLAGKGVDERLLTAVSNTRENAVNPLQMFGFYMGFVIGMFIVMGALTGASSTVIDSTAGEKERKTLELLLTAPIRRSSIMLGKYLAGVTFAFISPVLTAIGMSLAASFIVPLLSPQGASGFDLSGMLSVGNILMILLVILLLAAFMVALLMAIAVRTHSTKQAGTYMAPLSIIVFIPMIFMQMIPAVPPIWMFLIPLMNVMLVLRGLLMNTLPTMAIILTLVSSLVFLAIALRFAARGFGSEKVLLR